MISCGKEKKNTDRTANNDRVSLQLPVSCFEVVLFDYNFVKYVQPKSRLVACLHRPRPLSNIADTLRSKCRRDGYAD